MPIALDRYYTRVEVLALPDDGNRYELVHGELLVSPSPAKRHQLILGRLHAGLFNYLERVRAGRVFYSPADISWGQDDVSVQPDLFVLGPEHTGETSWKSARFLPLVVEGLSPSTARYDRFTKRRLYQEKRVALYWIIDDERRRVEIWTPEATSPSYEDAELNWRPDPASETFRLSLEELFAP